MFVAFLYSLSIHVDICDTFQLLAGFLQYFCGKLGETEDFKRVFFVYCVLESKLHGLLSNNSLFVDQLYEAKSLALRSRDLIFFTTDFQTVHYNLTIHY